MFQRSLIAGAIALAFSTCAMAPASAARHPDFRQYCRTHSNAAGATAFRCWTRSAARASARSFRHLRSARGRHRSDRAAAGLVTVKTAAGISITVAGRAAGNFTGFVSDLVAAGYRITLMGGWRRHGSCRRCDMHPRGLAIDINQTGRNRVTRAFPPGVTAMAARHGLTHGAIWGNPDQGHFELAGVHRYARHSDRSRYAHRHHGRRHYAAG
jgi:hypothetical protein